jgi:hypothetical protein
VYNLAGFSISSRQTNFKSFLQSNTQSHIHVSSITWPDAWARIKCWPLCKVLLVQNIIHSRSYAEEGIGFKRSIKSTTPYWDVNRLAPLVGETIVFKASKRLGTCPTRAITIESIQQPSMLVF